MKRVICSAAIAALVYPAFGFIAADFNAYNWPSDGRAALFAVYVILFFSICSMPIWD